MEGGWKTHEWMNGWMDNGKIMNRGWLAGWITYEWKDYEWRMNGRIMNVREWVD